MEKLLVKVEGSYLKILLPVLRNLKYTSICKPFLISLEDESVCHQMSGGCEDSLVYLNVLPLCS